MDVGSTGGVKGHIVPVPVFVEGEVAQPAQLKSKARANKPGTQTLEGELFLMISFLLHQTCIGGSAQGNRFPTQRFRCFCSRPG